MIETLLDRQVHANMSYARDAVQLKCQDIRVAPERLPQVLHLVRCIARV